MKVVAHKKVNFFCSALEFMVSGPPATKGEDRKVDFKTVAQSVVHKFASSLAVLASFSSSADVRIHALKAIGTVRTAKGFCFNQ